MPGIGRSRAARSTEPGRAEARALQAAGYVALSALVSGCTAVVGVAPRLELVDPAQGFKMLRPAAVATACRGETVLSHLDSSDLLGAAFRELLARDDEATAVLNARVESTAWTIGVYGKRCVTLTGDVVRATTTVLLPMDHAHHARERR